MITPCTIINKNIGQLFCCTHSDGYTRIRTPFLYPDGDVIDLFLKEGKEISTLSDLGETLRWLRMQSLSERRSPKQKRLIEDICLTHGVELFRGMLMLRLRTLEELAQAVTRLGLAAVRVGDLWFTFRTRAIESVTDEVADLLGEREVPFDQGERIPGRSGRIWRPDFHTRTPERSALVYVLSTGSRAAAKGIAEHVLASWYDLSHLQIGPEALKFVSLFDDTADVWADEDFKLVGDLSDIAYWSRPDDFVEKLAA
jgi:Domain of unknown function DUF1828